MDEEHDYKYLFDGNSNQILRLDMKEEFDNDFPVIPWSPLPEEEES